RTASLPEAGPSLSPTHTCERRCRERVPFLRCRRGTKTFLRRPKMRLPVQVRPGNAAVKFLSRQALKKCAYVPPEFGLAFQAATAQAGYSLSAELGCCVPNMSSYAYT